MLMRAPRQMGTIKWIGDNKVNWIELNLIEGGFLHILIFLHRQILDIQIVVSQPNIIQS